MSRDFDSKNLYDFLYNRIYYRAKWGTEAYPENGGLGPNMIKDTNFLERVHYGVIDDQNNSVIPMKITWFKLKMVVSLTSLPMPICYATKFYNRHSKRLSQRRRFCFF